MIHYYTNREISEVLGINLAKWKRWSRAFLPPDPLGGMQSGYARRYTFNDLFKVFLGGHLLSHLKLSMVESVQVVDDLSPWLKKKGFLRIGNSNKKLVGGPGNPVKYRIYFCAIQARKKPAKKGFRYLIQKTVRTRIEETSDQRMVFDSYREEEIVPRQSKITTTALLDDPFAGLINLTALYTMVVHNFQQ